uniref:Uncharacterized protein n=1 Tax=Panagrolaimus sp. PS1159 TaxID=55785 RepID=A0AC35F4U1_9BILA
MKENDAIKSVRKIINQDLLVGWCLYVTQRKTAAWMSFVVQKESGHWRYKLQHCALVLCGMLIRYIGKPLISLSWLDGGFCGSLLYGGETEFRTMSSQIMVDSTSNGSLIVTEVSPLAHRMRISRISNLFQIKPLYEIAFEA